MTANEYLLALEDVLPADLPNRAAVVEKSARHLALMRQVNESINLTRIIEPREAAIKHVLDSVVPWPLLAPFHVIADVGSGPGFPGIPLALLFPEKRVLLIESIGKKARFLEDVVRELQLGNVEVHGARAEEVLRNSAADLIVARAVASCENLLKLLKPVLANRKLVLYKGGDVEQEIAQAGKPATIAMRYELPNQSGARAVVVY
jgi:16S rRNA (guanine527-N7)-methyltransferase